MNVLSLFDGMSCGQLALEKAGVRVHSYYASEIDKYAIKVTQANYPCTLQIGDVTKLQPHPFLNNLGLLLGGSPCQSFSNAVSYNTGFEGKSKLFWHYVRLLRELKPKYFLLENVPMKKEWEDVITRELGVEPVEICSSRFSAQVRRRSYWTNIPFDKELPTNLDLICDIQEHDPDEKYYYNESYTYHGWDKNVCATLHINGHDILKRVQNVDFKCHTLTAVCGGNQQKKIMDVDRVRKLTPLEYERLQTVPDNYTSMVSDSQRYKMIGNGWTIDVIAWILRGLK